MGKLWAKIRIIGAERGAWCEISIYHRKRDAIMNDNCDWIIASDGRYPDRHATKRNARRFCRRLKATVVEV